MKLAKSLLLGTAAALATAAGAQAADLPMRKAAPVAVEYVRVCSTYGAGFFVIPGTESCIKLGGRIRAEALIQERFARSQDYFGFRARGRMQMDVRTPTPYGLLRTFVRFQITADSGTPYNGGLTAAGPVQKPILDQGYIQFGGLTAGRVTSFFANGDLPTGHWGTLRFDDAPDITLFAYTFALGNGFSISASAEDPFARRLNNNGVGIGLGSAPFAPIVIINGVPTFVGDPGVAGLASGGFEWPDVVGNIKYTGTWGTAQVSGAVHQLVDVGTSRLRGPADGPGAPAIVTRRAFGDELGFAVAGYLGVNLPMIAAGDAAWLAATYADGAINYTNGGITGSGGFGGNTLNATGALVGGIGGPANLTVSDAFVNGRGRFETTEAFSVAGGFRHYWVPSTLRSNVFGSYWHVDQGGGDRRRGNGVFLAQPGGGFLNISNTRFGLVSFDEFRVGGNLIWSPVSGLDIGVEVLYANVQTENGRIVVSRPSAGASLARFRLTDEEDLFEGRIRVQRDF